ncbi:MAG: nucleotide-binding protein [Acidimicrobiia bacterium]
MIVVVGALKGGVGKTTTSVYLACIASRDGRPVTLVDADPQASSADWAEHSDDERLAKITVAEAPTERLLARVLDQVTGDEVAVVDTPPGNERLLSTAFERAAVVIIPARVGGVEEPRVRALLDLVPERAPAGLVVCSARSFTRDYQQALAAWADAGVPVWGTIPERVAIAAGPRADLAVDGLDAYLDVWRRAGRAARR